MSAMGDIKSIEDLYESIGGFGRFQLFAMIAILYPELPAGFIGMIPVFVSDYPESWRCLQDNKSELELFEGSLNNDDLCSCNGTLDGGDKTIISEWQLVCDSAWVADFITSIQMAGMLCGGLFGSQIADLFGRKKPMYIFCFIMMVAAGASGFTNNPYLYAVSRFLVGASMACIITFNFGVAYLVIGTVYPMEFLTPGWRTLCGSVGPWGEGVMLLAAIAYFIQPWRELSWVTSLPVATAFLAFPFLPESPRWLLRKGKVLEAKRAFDQIARWNGYPKVHENVIKHLAMASEEQTDRKKVGCCQFLMNRQLRGKIILFMSAWFSLSTIYYGISFNTKNLSGSPYLNILFQGAVDSVAFPTAVFANIWLGRRKAFMSYMIIASTILVGIILMELNIGVPYSEAWVTGLSLSGKFFSCGAWSAVRCFTAESFPTSIRSTAIGLCTFAAAFGGVIAPQLAFLGSIYRPAPYFVFGGLAMASTGLSLLLTETKGKALEDNVLASINA